MSQVEVFAGLRSIRDPFDRLIVSAALDVGARLVTKDGALWENGLVETIW
jgi:PIN domain nuclease of toxin-antitoxin system